MKTKLLIPVIALLLLFAVSCAANISLEVKTHYTDKEKRFQVGAAKGWESMKGSLSEDAVIELGDSGKQKYFILRADEKSRSEYEFEEYAEYIKKDFLEKLGENLTAELKSKTIGRSQALQAQITAASKEGEITYILTIINEADYYVITCGWYRAEMKKLNREDVLSVINSYKSLNNSTESAAASAQ